LIAQESFIYFTLIWQTTSHGKKNAFISLHAVVKELVGLIFAGASWYSKIRWFYRWRSSWL